MKNLVLVFIAIIALSISGCQFKSHKLIKAEAPEAVPTKVVAPAISVEKRAGKFALIVNGALATEFEYDLVDISHCYPILIKKDKQFIFLQGKLVGPFDNLNIINKDIIKISKDRHQLNGFFYVYDSHEDLFKYPVVEIVQVDTYGNFERGLYWVHTKSGKKGLISTGYAVEKESFILPVDNYIYTDIRTQSEQIGIIITKVSARYYKKSSVGEIFCYKAILGGNKKPEKVEKTVNDIKLKSRLGVNAKIIGVNKAKNALVYSEKGYGLINLDGVILVPAVYADYQKIGDSAYIFSNTDETLKVDLNGKKI